MTRDGLHASLDVPLEPTLISELKYTPANREAKERGLLGFVQCVVGGLLRVDCALRRTRDGRLTISFPVKHDQAGRAHPLVSPANAEARLAIETAVFDAVALDLGTANRGRAVQGNSP